MQLGQPIPNDAHAVSVSLPLWEDVKGYEEGVPSVINAMQLGYPRFVYHPFIKQLFAKAEGLFASENEFCMVFPSKRIAKVCANYCLEEQEKENREQRINNLQSPVSNLYSLTLPKGLERSAKEFWMHAGFIVSSRWAEAALQENGEQRTENSKNLDSQFSTLDSPKQTIKEKLAELSGANIQNIYLYPSGMAAIYSAFEAVGQLSKGGRTIQLGFPYVDTLKIQQRFGKGVFIDYRGDADVAKLEAELSKGGVNAVFTEFPLNPLLTCVDLEPVSKLCQQYGAALVIDDTLATWANLDTLKYADIAVTSLTKFFSGVGDVCAGSLILNQNSKLFSKLKTALDANFEDLLFDADATVLAKNCQDFEARIAKINATAEKFYESLKSEIKNQKSKIHYTKGNQTYEKYKKSGGGYGGIISLVLPTEQEAQKYFDELTCKKGPSLGTNYTLACPYTMLAHYYERDFAENSGIPFHLIRFSVGVE